MKLCDVNRKEPDIFWFKFDNCHVAHYIKIMSIPNIHKREIPPTHPGEMLREDFMTDYHLTPTSLASALGVSRQTVHDLLKEKRAVTPLMALRLSRLFGNSPEFWLKAQQARDLWGFEQQYLDDLDHIHPLTPQY